LIDLCQPDDRRWKGLGIGLAAAIKLTPGIFIAFLLLTRRWRAAAVASGTFAGAVLLGFAVLPSASAKYWFGRLFLDSQRVGGVSYVSNQSLNGVLVRLLHGVNAAVPWWLVASVAVGAAGLLLSVWASRAGEELLAVTLCALTGLLVSPISWSHHWVWVALGIVVAIDFAYFRGYRAAWVLLVGLLGLFASGPVLLIWKVPNSNNREYHWHGWQLLIGNAYVIIGLALLAVAYAGLRRWRSAGADHVGPGSAVTASPPTGPVLQRR
ncbi:MAG TPA: glycosyltransferase 87 family protein, partial [Actinomycetota bacterium]|nr:glycosyltransferase 87 family protein [Actinomycetota bacterium]